MNWKKLEKHNVIDIVRRESLLEFSKEQLLKCVENTRRNDFYITLIILRIYYKN